MRKSFILLMVLFSFLVSEKSNALEGSSDTTTIKVKRKGGQLPHIGFACELDPGPLQSLLSTPNVISDIRAMNANISLALRDLSEERALAVRQLNQEGIPVIAWLALPQDQGYYMNASNSNQAIARFKEFEAWTAKYDLKWIGVGLDIEPNLAEFGSLSKSSKWNLVKTILARSVSLERDRQSKEASKIYSGFIKKIEEHGYPVQTYQLSFVADERKVHSTLLDRIAGLVSAKGKNEALMLYTSFTHNFGSALIWSYGSEAQAIVVGVTGGGVDTTNSRDIPLSWRELSNDLIVASHFTNDIGIFSLEGCVRSGFLPLLKNFDWNQTVVLSVDTINKVTHFRRGIQTAIWIVTNLPYIFGVIIILIVWLFWRRHKRRKNI